MFEEGRKMTKDEKAKLIVQAMEDQEFASKLYEAETEEEVMKVFSSKGIELSLEEIRELRDAASAASDENGEISEEDLTAVAGGLLLPRVGWPPIIPPIPRFPRPKIGWPIW